MRLEHLLSRALVLAYSTLGKKKKMLKVYGIDWLTLAVNLKKLNKELSKKQSLVAQLVRVLH